MEGKGRGEGKYKHPFPSIPAYTPLTIRNGNIGTMFHTKQAVWGNKAKTQ